MSVVQEPDGTPVLTLGDSALVGGYLITGYDEGGRTWRRQVETGLYVDGHQMTSAVLDSQTITLTVLIESVDWAGVKILHNALLDAVEVPGWRLAMPGVTWLCDPADSVSPMPPLGVDSDCREVTLTITAQPSRGV